MSDNKVTVLFFPEGSNESESVKVSQETNRAINLVIRSSNMTRTDFFEDVRNLFEEINESTVLRYLAMYSSAAN